MAQGRQDLGVQLWVASCPPWAHPAARAPPVPGRSLSSAEPLSCSPWCLLQGGHSAVPSHGPSASSTALRNLRGPWVLGRPGYLLWMGWVTSGTPLPLSGRRFSTHSFINFPKVLPLSGQFSQRPRGLWARLCAGYWIAGRHCPSPSRDVPVSLPAQLLHLPSVP